MKNLSIGIQTFEEIIQSDCVYVDKTKHIYDLINQGKTYFISRPRRFGKSLFCSTLEQVFLGKKELFKNLWIYNSDYDWKKYPVLHFNFGEISRKSEIFLIKGIHERLGAIAKDYAIELPRNLTISGELAFLITVLSEQGKVVVIIDEYDKPIIDHMTNHVTANENREVLREFYEAIKNLDRHLKFIFLTGVSKFAHVSIFSGLNNLDDISLEEFTADMFGYTQIELEKNFCSHIDHVTNKLEISRKETLRKIKQWYNGYRFSPDNELAVYNPFSTMLMLRKAKFRNFWFQSGTPKFLIDLIDSNWIGVRELEEIDLSLDEVDACDLDTVSMVPMLYQTGYLTIKKFRQDSENLVLTFSNYEVRTSFLKNLLIRRSLYSITELNNYSLALRGHLANKDIDSFCKTMQVYYAGIPYDLQDRQQTEQDFQLLFFALLKLLGFKIITEDKTNIGRIDAVLEMQNVIYIFEFKINQTAMIAINQIEEKTYYEKYELMKKAIIIVGINFNIKKRNITEWKSKEIKSR